MCMSKPKAPPAPVQPAPTPVNTSQTVGEQTAPELVTANEQDLDVKKKKKVRYYCFKYFFWFKHSYYIRLNRWNIR